MGIKTTGRVIDFTKYKLRICRTLHFCESCKQNITFGQRYYDGGYGKRAHDLCADADALERQAIADMQAANREFYKDDTEP